MECCSKCGKENLDHSEVCSSCDTNFFENALPKMLVPDSLESPNVKETKYDTIGGWLILIAFGRVIGLLTALLTMWTYFNLSVNISPEEKIIFQINVLYSILIFVLDILLLFLMFKRKKPFPYVMIGFTIFALLYFVLRYALYIYFNITTLGSHPRNNVIFSIISCAIWIPYLLKSKRVKETFVK